MHTVISSEPEQHDLFENVPEEIIFLIGEFAGIANDYPKITLHIWRLGYTSHAWYLWIEKIECIIAAKSLETLRGELTLGRFSPFWLDEYYHFRIGSFCFCPDDDQLKYICSERALLYGIYTPVNSAEIQCEIKNMVFVEINDQEYSYDYDHAPVCTCKIDGDRCEEYYCVLMREWQAAISLADPAIGNILHSISSSRSDQPIIKLRYWDKRRTDARWHCADDLKINSRAEILDGPLDCYCEPQSYD